MALGIILIRLARLRGEAETAHALEAITDYGERLRGYLTTVYPDRVEQEPLPTGAP